jgi:hypothetical protein
MGKFKDRFTVKFDLKHETIAALKIAAAVWQKDPRDVLEQLVADYLKDFVTVAINNIKSTDDKSINDKSINDKSINDKSINDKSINDKSKE